MFCNKCGNEITDDSYFCNKCGSPVIKPKNEPFDVVTLSENDKKDNNQSTNNINENKVINEKKDDKNGLATASLVMGIIAAIISFVPYANSISFILGIISIVFAIVTLTKKSKSGQAVAGLILSIIALLISYLIDVAATKLIIRLGEDIINNSPYFEEYNFGDYFDEEYDNYDEFTYNRRLPFSKNKYISLEKYNQIEEGMTYSEVVNIIGCDGKKVKDSFSLGEKVTETKTYTWYGKDGISYAKISFIDDKVIGKSQEGLE